MIIRFHLLVVAILASSFAACGRATLAPSGSHKSDDHGEVTTFDKDPVARLLTKDSWCLAAELDKPFREDVATGYTYSTNGSTVVRALIQDKSNLKVLADKQSSGTWTFENGLMTLRDPANGAVFVTKLEIVQYTPVAKGPALWLTGMAAGEQTCLKSSLLTDASKSTIHCRCNLDEIKARAQSASIGK